MGNKLSLFERNFFFNLKKASFFMSSELPGKMIEIARGECLHFDVILVDQSEVG
jgi:hypothetical protein